MKVEHVANNAKVYTVEDGDEIILVALWEDEEDEDIVTTISSCDCTLDEECPHIAAVMRQGQGERS